ncbi:hypothetical protein OS493_006693 [Desmophyllum pertusum]|uniref:Uncharacterized protein n=1 Tax=Desmophyllum pertusum TaxID=174260 RepID=A0A9X0D4L8_9CNID|nr:hypothetical protein OS493_006693 [Desmophyllum pertusum]
MLWKKGNEFNPKSFPEPISPDTPSGHIAGSATPNTLDPKPFNIDNIGMQTLEEEKEETLSTEPVEVVPQHNLVLDPPPLPRKSFSMKREEEPTHEQHEDKSDVKGRGTNTTKGRHQRDEGRRTQWSK